MKKLYPLLSLIILIFIFSTSTGSNPEPEGIPEVWQYARTMYSLENDSFLTIFPDGEEVRTEMDLYQGPVVIMNIMGKAGWEVFHIDVDEKIATYYFKKRIL